MTKTTFFKIIFALIVFCVCAVSADDANKQSGENESYSNPRMKGSPYGRMWGMLDLTEDQKKALMVLREEHDPLVKKSNEEMRSLRQKIHDELLKDNPDKSLLSDYSNEIGELNKKISDEMIYHMLQVKQLFTKEQFESITNKFDGRKGPENRGHMSKGRRYKGNNSKPGAGDGSENGK